MPGLSFVSVARDRKFDAALETSRDIELRARVEHLDELVRVVDEQRPDALLVSLAEDPQAVFGAIDKLLSPKPLVFFYGPDDSRLILQAMRSGGYEYIAPASDAEAQLVAAIQRASQESSGSASLRQSTLVAVMGAKGGVGTSFVTCQLGAALAELAARTALVDGHLRHGDVALYMDLAPKYDFSSLATGENPIDSTYLHTALVRHASGAEVLAAPRDVEEAEGVTASRVAEVVELLRNEFDWVVWDMPQDFDDRSLRVLDHASPILLITTPDVPALNHTRMQLELLARLGRSQDEIRIILNRTKSRENVSERDAADFLGRPIDASIPNDFPRASACLDEGRTLSQVAPRSSIARAVGELALVAHTWSHRSAPAPTRRPGLLDRFKTSRSS